MAQTQGNVTVTNFPVNLARTVAAPSTTFVNGTTYFGDYTNSQYSGLKLFLNISTIGTSTVIVTIQEKDTVSGSYVDLLSSTTINATGLVSLTVLPSITTAANISSSNVLAPTYRYKVVVAGIGNAIGSIGEILVI